MAKLTEWMEDAPVGSRIYFRDFPNAETYSNQEFYEKIDSGNWHSYSDGKLINDFEFTVDAFGDHEDAFFVRKER